MKQCHAYVEYKKIEIPNVPFKDIEEFYRRTIFIPYLDDLLCSLKEGTFYISQRHCYNVITVSIMPYSAADNPFSCLKPAVKFYEDDLPGYQDITEAEFKL